MRYAFTQASISLINRVWNATSGLPKETIEGIKKDFMYEGVGGNPLVAAMWFSSDVNMDWAADSDGMHENPYAHMIWNVITKFDGKYDDGSLPGTSRHAIWDAWEKMTDAYTDFENPLWLACCVVNAMRALEGSNQNIWSDDAENKAVDDEFKTERDQWDAMFKAVMANVGDSEIDAILARDHDELKAEIKAAEAKERARYMA